MTFCVGVCVRLPSTMGKHNSCRIILRAKLIAVVVASFCDVRNFHFHAL